MKKPSRSPKGQRPGDPTQPVTTFFPSSASARLLADWGRRRTVSGPGTVTDRGFYGGFKPWNFQGSVGISMDFTIKTWDFTWLKQEVNHQPCGFRHENWGSLKGSNDPSTWAKWAMAMSGNCEITGGYASTLYFSNGLSSAIHQPKWVDWENQNGG